LLKHRAALQAALINVNAILNERSCGDTLSFVAKTNAFVARCQVGGALLLDEKKAEAMMAALGWE
jgi:hypothetical protein